jgi:hypothetical protein
MRAALLALLLAMAAFGVRPASAAVSGLVTVQQQSAFNSDSFKSATATCPNGKKVIGGGGLISGDDNKVVLTALVPNAAMTAYTAVANESGSGTPTNWLVRVYAICANATAVPGLQQITVGSVTDSNLFKPASASCPSGQKVVGTGARILGLNSGAVAINRIVPQSRQVHVGAAEIDSGTTSNWSVQSIAICANNIAALDVEVKSKLGPSGSAPVQVTSTPCSSGKRVIGLGGDFVNASAGRVFIQALVPSTDQTSASLVGAETAFGTPSSWTPVAYAICATP